MKSIFSVLLLTLFLNGCASVDPNHPLVGSKSEKQHLIDLAETGDIQAMLELHEHYLFPETEEGLSYYKKWYPLVLKSQDLQGILDFKKVLELKGQDSQSFLGTKKRLNQGYTGSFINGKQKVEALEDAAAALGDVDSLLKQLSRYEDNYRKHLDTDKFTQKHAQLLANPNTEPEQLKALYRYDSKAFFRYETYEYKPELARQVKEVLEAQGLAVPMIVKYDEFKKIIKKESPAKITRYLNDILNSGDDFAIKSTSFYLLNLDQIQQGARFLEKILSADNVDYQQNTFYFEFYYGIKQRIIEKKADSVNIHLDETAAEKIFANLKQSALKDDYHAAYYALSLLDQKTVIDPARAEFEQQLDQLQEARIALAKFKSAAEAKEMLEQIANAGSAYAAVTLASQPITKENQDQVQKWRDFILDSQNPSLLSQLKNAIKGRHEAALLADIEERELNQHNIYTLRDRYKKEKNDDIEAYERDIKLAASYGDTYSRLQLADYFYRSQRKEESRAIYKQLAQEGSWEALDRLSDYYANADSDRKNFELAIQYLEQAYALGDNRSVTKLAFAFICNDPKESQCAQQMDGTNWQKANFYFDKLVGLNDNKMAFKLALIAYEKAPAHASHYFEQLLTLDEYEAYSYLADIYQQTDPKKAFDYLKQGSDKRDLTAMSKIGDYYLQGIGVTANDAAALAYYQQAYETAKAKRERRIQSLMAFKIGNLYENGGKYIMADKEIAIDWYQKSNSDESRTAIQRLSK